MACEPTCKTLQGPKQYIDSQGNPTPFYTEPDTGVRVLSGNKCGMALNLPGAYRNTDTEVTYLSFGNNCPDWCAVSHAVLKIAENTYVQGGDTTAAPAETAPLGYQNDQEARDDNLVSGDVYYNTTTNSYDIVM